MSLVSLQLAWQLLQGSASESVEGSTLSFESVDDVKSGDSLSLSVFGVGHRISDDILEELTQDRSRLIVDSRADSLHSSSSGESSDGWLGDPKNGLLHCFRAVSLGTSLPSGAFASFCFHSSDLSFAWHL